jgi:signal transduction histidine kinase
VAVLLAGLLGPVAAARAGDRQKQVLVLGRHDAQLQLVMERNLPSLLNQGIAEGVNSYSEYIDASELADPDYRTVYRDFLRLKYKAERIDLIVALGTPALEFAASDRERLFPGAPVVFYVRKPPKGRLANSTGLVNELHFNRSLELAVALQPDLEHLYVVSGAGFTDRTTEGEARRDFSAWERRLDFTYFSGLVTRDLEGRLRTLPPHSAVFVVLVTKDGAGKNFQQMDYLSRVASVANAPTYSWADAAVDAGIVGGSRRDQLAETTAIATLALRVLQGERADDIPVSSLMLDVNEVDWRQLRRWGIGEARVPAGTTVMFREPGMWVRNKRYIIGALAFMLAQGVLIVGLLFQRSLLLRTGRQLRASQGQLRTSYDRIRQLGRRLLHAQELERGRIARELHDDISQQVAVLSVELDVLRSSQQQVDNADRLSHLLDRANDISTSVHEMSHQLHPGRLQLIGLVGAIESLQRDFSRADLSVAFSYRDVPPVIDDDVGLSLFRVAQEALRNAVKHSNARHIWVALAGEPPGLELTITDDGKGFDVEHVSSDGIGLMSMKERLESVGGVLEIQSTPGSGTCLRIRVATRQAPTAMASHVLSA